MLALDGAEDRRWPTSATWTGCATVVDELEPLLRRRGRDLAAPVGRLRVGVRAGVDGGWDEARRPGRRGARAQPPHRATPPTPGYFQAHHGWFARLAGDLDERPGARPPRRRARPRRSTTRGGTPRAAGCSPRPWWRRATAAEAEAAARPGLAATEPARAGGVAAALRRPAGRGDRRRATTGVAAERAAPRVECPPGQAWVAGADCYLLVAGRRAPRRPRRASRGRSPRCGEATTDAWTLGARTGRRARPQMQLGHQPSRAAARRRSAPAGSRSAARSSSTSASAMRDGSASR